MEENLLTKNMHWGSYSARTFKQKLAQILYIPHAPEERQMLLTVPQCCWYHLSKKAHQSYSDGPPATWHACYVLLLPGILCGFNHWHLSYLLYRFNLFIAWIVLYQENVANKTSFLSDATRILCVGFLPCCRCKHLKRKYKAMPTHASR